MGSVFLTWKENNTDEDGHRVYRSLTPIDPEAPPTPLASLGPNVTNYQDTTALDDVTYYYRVSAYKSGAEVFSPQLGIYTDPDAPTAIIATGGVVSDIEVGGIHYRVHTFTSSDTFTVSAGAGDVDYLVVGGGGAGGRNNVGGGGGGGGVVTGTLWRTPGSYPVIVGAGGLCPNPQFQGNNGEDSSVFGVVAFGGGGGGAGGTAPLPNGAGQDGGSGGGGGGTWSSGTNRPGGVGVAGQGFNGGNGVHTADTSSRASGGGGGAGQAGANAGNGVGGKGGDGVQSSITGTATYYGGGGGGGSNGGTRGLGGLGGGGAGGRSGQICVDGTPNTGGGGGGRSETTPPNTSAPGASGGSGIVVVRYRLFGGA